MLCCIQLRLNLFYCARTDSDNVLYLHFPSVVGTYGEHVSQTQPAYRKSEHIRIFQRQLLSSRVSKLVPETTLKHLRCAHRLIHSPFDIIIIISNLPGNSFNIIIIIIIYYDDDFAAVEEFNVKKIK